MYYDSTRDSTIPRTYIVSLREKARALERELALAEKEIQHAADAELMVRGAGRIRFKENDEARYLGASSGIAMTRLVMEMAKQNTDSKSIKDVVPEFTAQEIKEAFAQEDSKPTSKVYPMISSIPQPNLPPKALTYKLIDLFVAKGTSTAAQTPSSIARVTDSLYSTSIASDLTRAHVSARCRGGLQWLYRSLSELPAANGHRHQYAKNEYGICWPR